MCLDDSKISLWYCILIVFYEDKPIINAELNLGGNDRLEKQPSDIHSRDDVMLTITSKIVP